ncbi:hypothetical protein Slala03_71730 [Streptomyces lavendulae subsp. lavendulae]|nr:hypothetical protein Slala03_71730 [Streptomyces lavendulae subsp. lavendulae]
MGPQQLSDHTTLRLGGSAPLGLSHTHDTDWPYLARTAAKHTQRPFTLGGGSNTLAPDQGTAQPVIHMATRGIRTQHRGDGQEIGDRIATVTTPTTGPPAAPPGSPPRSASSATAPAGSSSSPAGGPSSPSPST